MTKRRLRVLLLLCLAAAMIMLALPSGASASGYCGRVAGVKVYTSGVACSTARYYVARWTCPRRWRRYRVHEEFGFEVIGYGCRSGGRRFKGQR